MILAHRHVFNDPLEVKGTPISLIGVSLVGLKGFRAILFLRGNDFIIGQPNKRPKYLPMYINVILSEPCVYRETT